MGRFYRDTILIGSFWSKIEEKIMNKEIKKFVIKRKRWLRGGARDYFSGISMLRTPGGKQCCLGFYGRALGCRIEDIFNVGSPDSTETNFWPEWLVGQSLHIVSKAGRQLMRINDDSNLSDHQREQLIKKIFLLHGVRVRFED